MIPENWYILIGETQYGPYDEETVAALIQNGRVKGFDLTWKKGLPDWIPVGKIFVAAQGECLSSLPPPSPWKRDHKIERAHADVTQADLKPRFTPYPPSTTATAIIPSRTPHADGLRWFLLRGGVQRGPFDTQTVEEYVADGLLKPDDLVWRDGMLDWAALDKLFAAPRRTMGEVFALEGQAGITAGTIVDGKYRIERPIGEGGMGAVYEATHQPIGRKVAMKVLHLSYARDPQVVLRFQREAKAAGSIGHDNICEVTDLGRTADESPYLVMPLLRGEPLSRILVRCGTLDLVRMVDIAAQTLSALQAAHEARIVHRDLKPDNIFITRLGDREDFVKLLDFGISKVMDADLALGLTRTGTVLGTPFYMAPEQARGARELDARVDLYAMGVILYEALTGWRPFDGDSYNAIMFKIIAEPIVPAQMRNPAIPERVSKIIAKAMEKDPERRYSSATQMRKSLLDATLKNHTDRPTR